MNRRRFVASLGMAVAAAASGRGEEKPRSKREALLSLRQGGPGPGYVPAAFFLHLDERSLILGADCTVPGDARWGRLRTAITTAHAFRE